MFRLNVPASFNDCMSVKEQIMWLFFHKEFTLKAGANVTITREGDETVISAKGDGFAPIVRITTITGGHRVTVIDAEHPLGQSFDVMDGVDGQDGADGQDGQDGQDGADGEDGTSIIVKSVDTVPGGVNLVLEDRNGDHTIFLTNGPEGPQGAQGPQGPQGVTGATGATGPAGFSPTITSEPISGGHRLTITDATGTSSVDVLDGENAAAATIMVGTTTTSAPGENASVVNSGSSSAAVLDFTIPRGAQGPQGVQGQQGIQGIQGEQGEQGEQGPAGPGVAAGGTAGQILSKVDGTDYNTEWVNPPEGGGSDDLRFCDNSNATGSYTYEFQSNSTAISASVTGGNAIYLNKKKQTSMAFNGSVVVSDGYVLTATPFKKTVTVNAGFTPSSGGALRIYIAATNGWVICKTDGTKETITSSSSELFLTGYRDCFFTHNNITYNSKCTLTFNKSTGKLQLQIDVEAFAGVTVNANDVIEFTIV